MAASRAVAPCLAHYTEGRISNILNTMVDDDISSAVRDDYVILLYGNRMILKFASKSQDKHIRQDLRLQGKLKLQLRKLNSKIVELLDVFFANRFKDFMDAAIILSEYDDETGLVHNPYNAEAFVRLFNKIMKWLKSELIAKDEEDRLKGLEGFKARFDADAGEILVTKAEQTKK